LRREDLPLLLIGASTVGIAVLMQCHWPLHDLSRRSEWAGEPPWLACRDTRPGVRPGRARQGRARDADTGPAAPKAPSWSVVARFGSWVWLRPTSPIHWTTAGWQSSRPRPL